MSNGHGGKREGSGRKALLELAGESRVEIIDTVKRIAAENDTTFGEELADMMFGKRKEKRLKMQAMQLFIKDVLPKVSETERTENIVLVPQIYLPEELAEGDAPDYKPH